MREKERIFVAIDAQNLWYGARESFGNKWRVDYRKLRDCILANTSGGDIVEAIVYLVVAPDKENSMDPFFYTLSQLGYKVKRRYMRYDRDKNYVFRTDWDVGITADAMGRLARNEFDTFVLVSGDGDFTFLVSPIKEAGKKVHVYSFEHSMSIDLSRLADRSYTMDGKFVFDSRRRKHENSYQTEPERPHQVPGAARNSRDYPLCSRERFSDLDSCERIRG